MTTPGHIISLIEDDPSPQSMRKKFVGAARILSGGSNAKDFTSKTLSDVLKSRLVQLSNLDIAELPIQRENLDAMDLQASQYLTGDVALAILQQFDAIDSPLEDGELSTSDHSALRTIVSLVFRWKVSKETKDFIKVSRGDHDHERLLKALAASVRQLLFLVFPDTPSRQSSLVGAMILHHHAVDLLPALFTLGWLPPGLCDDGPYIRASTLKLLSRFTLEESMEMLIITIRDGELPKTAASTIRYLLARRILQPNGVSALLSMIISPSSSEDEHISDLLDKYEQITRLLSTPPRGIATDEYLRIVVPQMVKILANEKTSVAHQRAVSFVFSSLVSTDTASTTIAFDVLSSILFTAFQPQEREGSSGGRREGTKEGDSFSSCSSPSSASYCSPMESVAVLSTFLATAPPLSSNRPLATILLSPIIEKLYSLLYYLDTRAISDPTEVALCKGLVHSWMKVTSDQEVCARLWSIVQGRGGEWRLSGKDELRLEWRKEIQQPALTLGDLSNLEVDAMSDLNPLQLRPDPVHLITLVQSLNRKDVASSLFIRILSAEYESLGRPDDPTQKLLRMQLMYQLQQRLPSSILSNPSHALAFVDHVLATSTTKREEESNSASSSLLADRAESLLRFVDEDKKDAQEQEEQVVDILRTAVDFLLSSLEANPRYVPKGVDEDRHVTRIMESLKALSVHASMALRQAAREASLVLMARRSGASVSSSSSSSTLSPSNGVEEEGKKSSQEVYQEALVFLQDPLLPVRAQGLAMLRHLVEGSSSSSSSPYERGRVGTGTGTLDDALALVPAILDIFLHSVQDEDSFLFLNAVQGLVAVAQVRGGRGREVVKLLVEVYVAEEERGMNKQVLDVKLRVGEALGEIISRCGQSLGGYVDVLLPGMFWTIRNRELPTTLRTSAISIVSRAVERAPVMMGGYIGELSSAMLDILELEHAVAVEPIRPRPGLRPSAGGGGGGGGWGGAEARRTRVEKEHHVEYASDKRGDGRGGSGAPTPNGEHLAISGLSGGNEQKIVVDNGEEATRKGADNGGEERMERAIGGDRQEDQDQDHSGGGGVAVAVAVDLDDDRVIDREPTGLNAKLSPFRRSAIHFLWTVVQTVLLSSGDGTISREFPVRRAGVVLRYVGMVDVDERVRAMAAQTVEAISEAARARVGVDGLAGYFLTPES